MGIDLHWEDENGAQLAALPDPKSLVPRFLPSPDSDEFSCLRFVDPYGDTVFNQLQVDQVAAELYRLTERHHDPEVEQHLHAVLGFVRQARDRVHTYIKFYGD